MKEVCPEESSTFFAYIGPQLKKIIYRITEDDVYNDHCRNKFLSLPESYTTLSWEIRDLALFLDLTGNLDSPLQG